MKLILDLALLLLLFWFFRKGVKLLFPKSNFKIEISVESQDALRKYRLRYFLVWTILFVLISALGYAALYFLDQDIFVSAKFEGLYYGVKPQAYIQTAMLFAALCSVVLAPFFNERLQKDGLSFYLDELQEHVQGYKIKGLKLLQLGFGLILLGALLYAQMQTFFVMNPKEGRAMQGFSSDYRFKLSDIKEINNQKELLIIFTNDDTLHMGVYDYNEKEVIDFINKNTP